MAQAFASMDRTKPGDPQAAAKQALLGTITLRHVQTWGGDWEHAVETSLRALTAAEARHPKDGGLPLARARMLRLKAERILRQACGTPPDWDSARQALDRARTLGMDPLALAEEGTLLDLARIEADLHASSPGQAIARLRRIAHPPRDAEGAARWRWLRGRSGLPVPDVRIDRKRLDAAALAWHARACLATRNRTAALGHWRELLARNPALRDAPGLQDLASALRERTAARPPSSAGLNFVGPPGWSLCNGRPDQPGVHGRSCSPGIPGANSGGTGNSAGSARACEGWGGNASLQTRSGPNRFIECRFPDARCGRGHPL
jgi:hypothetical protein